MDNNKRLVGALLFLDGCVLLGRRSNVKSDLPDVWDVIGGHVNDAETFEAALRRETIEEVGICPTEFEQIAVVHDASMEYRVFRVDGWSGGHPSICNDEHSEIAWFSLAAAAALEPLASELYRSLFRQLGSQIST